MDAMNFKKKSGVFLEVLRPKTNIIFKFNFYGFFGLLLPAGGPKCAADLLTAYYFARNRGGKKKPV